MTFHSGTYLGQHHTPRRTVMTDKSGLIMKYFVLKPQGADIYAAASRVAMRAYATHISNENSELRDNLLEWADRERDASLKLGDGEQ